MITLIIGDNQNAASALRESVIRRGLQCPECHVLSMGAAIEAVHSLQPRPALILVLLGSDGERTEAAMLALRAFEGAWIVAVGPRDPNRILKAFQAGATDYLDERCQIVDELMKSLERAAALAVPKSTLSPLLTVVAGSGGCGRTTLATNLAAIAAGSHGSSVLLDLDLRGGSAAALLNVRSRYTVADLCRNLGKLDRNMFEQSMLEHESGIRLLPAPESRKDVADVTAEGILRIVHLARTLSPYVVADLNDHTEGHQQVLRQSTHVLLVSRLDFAAVGNAQKTLEYLGSVGVERDRLHFVVNRSGQPGELPAGRVEQVLGLSRCEHVPDDAKSVNLSINCGRVCVLESPRSKFTAALRLLAHKVGAEGAPAAANMCRHEPAPAQSPASGNAPKPHSLLSRLGLTLG